MLQPVADFFDYLYYSFGGFALSIILMIGMKRDIAVKIRRILEVENKRIFFARGIEWRVE